MSYNSKKGYQAGRNGNSYSPPSRFSIPLISMDLRSDAEIKADVAEYTKAFELGQKDRLDAKDKK